MSSISTGPKPKLVFFQWDHTPNAGAAKFLLLHMQDHVKCLSQSFDVTVVNEDCDFAEVCDRIRPDIALFESGYRTHGSRRIDIRNVRADSSIPKIGLHNGDPWCDRRAGFLSDMEHWGIDTFFAICTMTPTYTPAAADHFFAWPNFIDPTIFHDYRIDKTVPVMLAGQSYCLYPWRQKVYPLLAGNYPSLICPQFKYESRAAQRMFVGEAYARALNASKVVPTCGTMGKEVVRKHFEIPAAMSCLLTERTPGLEMAGFVDGENCIFVDGEDVLDRLDHLFSHPEELERITRAGHDLVHARHTLAHRPQMREWYELSRQLRPGQRVVQENPFEPLRIADAAHAPQRPLAITALDRLDITQGDAALSRGDVVAARGHYDKALTYVTYLPEARLRLAICDLLEGKAQAALDRASDLVGTTTVDYGAADPDPAEWAFVLVSMICLGRLADAERLVGWYPALKGGELGYVRAALDRLAGRPVTAPDEAPFTRASVHALPHLGFSEWLERLANFAAAAGQDEIARALRERAAPVGGEKRRLKVRGYTGIERALRVVGLGTVLPNVPPLPEFGFLPRLGRSTARTVLRSRFGQPLNRLRQRLIALRENASRDGRQHRTSV